MSNKNKGIKVHYKVMLSFLAVLVLMGAITKMVKADDVVSYNIDKGCYVTISDEIASSLDNSYFEGYMTFEYLDKGVGEIIIESSTSKVAQFGDFGEVAKITKEGTNQWKKAKVELISDNINLDHTAQNNSDFVIKGTGKVRNIDFIFNTFNVK